MNRRFRRAVLIWHRRLGLASIPFVLILVVTGVLLNRTDSLDLDRRAVTHDWLLDWYGIDAGPAPINFAAGEFQVSWLAGRLYLDGAAVAENAAPLAGAVWCDPVVAAATADAVWLFTAQGELIEKAAPAGVPLPIDAVAAGGGDSIVLRTPSGAFVGDVDLLEWREAGAESVTWARRAPPPPAVAAAIAESWRGAGLPWERVLLDLHSGRLFGTFGPLVMDAAAAALILLGLTGVYNWWRVRRRP